MYTESFKEQVLVKIYNRGGQTVQVIEDELNLSVFVLRNWMKNPLPTNENRAPRKAKRSQD